jgi:hypothetical protein
MLNPRGCFRENHFLFLATGIRGGTRRGQQTRNGDFCAVRPERKFR